MAHPATGEHEIPAPAAERLVSLDAFRGATIALMVLVNTAGDWQHVYEPLQHSEWCLMTLVPVPGYGPGNLSVEGNLAHYVDRIVLGSHNYAATKTWDPEGVVSTLPSIATALFGILCGHILRLRRTLPEKTTYL